MNNYHYIIAGLPELLLKGENKDFSYRTIRDGIYSWSSDKDKRLIEWLEFGNTDSNLNIHFYNAALKHGNSFIRDYYKMDLQIRNRKVDYVARSNNAISASSAYTINPENCDISLEESDSARLDRIFQTADILEKEQMLDKYKWEKIDSFTTFNYFDINKILAFLAKAMLIERWNRLDREQGMKLFEKLVQEIKGTYKGVNYKD